MFQNNPILNLFSEDCNISAFFSKSNALIRDKNKRNRMIIDCGNKCGIKWKNCIETKINFLKIQYC